MVRSKRMATCLRASVASVFAIVPNKITHWGAFRIFAVNGEILRRRLTFAPAWKARWSQIKAFRNGSAIGPWDRCCCAGESRGPIRHSPARNQHGPCCLHEQNAQVAITSLRYLTEDGAVASRDLLRHETQPGGEVTAFGERISIAKSRPP